MLRAVSPWLLTLSLAAALSPEASWATLPPPSCLVHPQGEREVMAAQSPLLAPQLSLSRRTASRLPASQWQEGRGVLA